MAIVVGDRIKQYTTISGTGSISFSGTVTGYKAFSDVLSAGDETLYCVLDGANGETGWEVGIGTFNGTVLSRDTVLSSSTGSKISLSGNVSEVFITYSADRSLSYDSAGTKVGINTASPSYTLDVFGHDAWVQASGITVGASGILPGITALDDARVSGTKTSTYLLDFGLSTSGIYLGNETQSNLGTANNNVHIGEKAGSGVTNATDNIIIGPLAGPHITTGSKNVVIGSDTSIASSNDHNIFIGYQSADTTAVGDHSVGVGYRTGYDDGGRSVNIGHDAGWSDNSNSIYTTSVGYSAFTGSHNTTPPSPENSLRYGTAVGYQAGYLSYGSYSSTFIGALAGYEGPGWNSVCIGMEAGRGIKDVGKHDHLFIGNAQPSANGTLIKGMFNTKEVAVGKCDVGISGVATFQVYPNSATSKGILVKSAVSQSADLTQWQNSSSVATAAMTPSGILNVYGVVASGDVTVVNLTTSNNINAASGIVLATNTPAVTTNTLYNVGGSLYFSGSELASTGGVSAADLTYVSGIAVYGSGQAQSLGYASGVAAYASGQAIENETAIATNVTNIATNTTRVTALLAASGQAVYASGQATSLNVASGVANYASGQAIENEGDILSLMAASGQAVYASGNTANIAFGSNAEGDILYHNGTSFVKLAKGTNNHVLTMDGNVPNWEASSGGGGTSAEATYASGQATSLNVASGVANYASGQAIANESDITALLAASGQAVYSSGVVTGGNPTFTDVQLGQYIYHDGDADTFLRFGTNLVNLVAGNWSAIKLEKSTGKIQLNNSNQNLDVQIMADDSSVILHTDATTKNVGINTITPGYTLDVVGHDAWVQATGVIVGASGTRWQDSAGGSIATMTPSGVLNTYGVVASGAGVRLHQVTPTVTTDTLYNVGGSLYFDGSSLTDISNYASGQATSLNVASGVANYASGQAIANESDITALLAASGQAVYASGNTANITFGSNAEGDILYHNGTKFIRLAKGTDNHVLTMNGNSPNWEASLGSDLLAASGQAVYASGQAIENETDIAALLAASGQAVYASGNTANITFGSNAEGDMLYHNGTKFIRLAKGTNNHVLTMDGNTPGWEAGGGGGISWDGSTANGVATYKDGDEATVESNLTFTGNILTVTTSSSSEGPTVIKGAANQAADLTSWQNAGGASVAAMTASGVLNTYGIVASGAGLNMARVTPTTTTDTLYNVGGDLYFNGSAFAPSGLAGLNGSGLWGGYNRTNTLLLNRPPGESPYYGIGNDCSDNIGIGYHALRYIAYSVDNIALGKSSSGRLSSGDRNVSIGLEALYNNQVGHDNVALGYNALWTVAGSRNVGIGKSAGYAETGSDMLYIAKGTESANGTIIKGDMANKYLAIGKADVTLSTDPATLQLYPNAATDKVLLIRGYASQSDDLTSWQTSAGAVVAGMTPSGVLNTYGIVASGAGITLDGVTITTTAAEINLIDGGTARGTDAIADGDGVLINDDGTMKMTTVQTLDTYLAQTTKTLTNKTLTSPKINEDVVMSATATELNLMDGVTATTTELNYVDVATVGTAEASKALTLDANKSFTGVKDGSFTQFDAWVNSSGVNVGASGISMGGSLRLNTDSSLIGLGDGNDFRLTHNGTTGGTIYGSPVTIISNGAATWGTNSGALSVNSAAALNLNPAGGSAIVLDGTISIDAGVVTGATSITSTDLIGTNVDGIIGADTARAGTFTIITANTSVVPDAAGGADLGSTSAEWGDVYIADDKKIKFGNGQDASIEYDEDGTDTLSISGVPVTFSKATKHPLKANSDGATVTFDLNESNMHSVTLGGNRTFATSNATIGQRFIIRIKQDGSTRTVTWGTGSPNSFGTILWAGGSAPDLTDGGNKADIIGFICTAEGSPNSFDGFVVAQNI